MSNNRSFGIQRMMNSALLLLLTALGSASGYCRQGSEWIEYNGSCYHWSGFAVAENWFRAQLNCQKFGGNLVSVGSLSDNNFLLRLTQCRVNFWLGMVNTVHAQKAQVRGYEWWDGTQHNYTSLNPQTTDHYDCVFSQYNGRWQNYPCQGNFTYVCKAPTAHGSPDDRQLSIVKPEEEEQQQQEANQEELDLDDEAVWFTGRTDGTTSGWRPTPTRPPIGPERGCQAGWQRLDNSCYFMSDNRTNYFNAQMSCQAMGASVTSILTVREHTLLTVTTGCHSQMWIGLEKARPCFKQPNRDHCWVWMDQSPVNYFEWASGQTLDRRDAECVILNGQWTVVNCYLEFRYICKKYAHLLKSNE